MAKILQSQDELQEHLREQISFMLRSAALYDEGYREEAKRLALHLRILLHDTSKSHSLLGLLGIKNQIQLYDTSTNYDPDNLIPYSGLVSLEISKEEARYAPRLGRSIGGMIFRITPFDDWWAKVVIVDKSGSSFTRSDLVLSIVHKDGGAHIDPKLDEFYANLTRRNSMGWFFEKTGALPESLKEIELACIRQITHEILVSLYEENPECFPSGNKAGGMEVLEQHKQDIELSKRFYNAISSPKVQRLISEVKALYATDQMLFELYKETDAHGAFDPDSIIPRILINPLTGLNEANIAFQLINAIQFKSGYPTTPKNIFNDKRQNVIRELNSNLFSIRVAKELQGRGFELSEYIEPTLSAIKSVLGNRSSEDIKDLPIRRIHYESTVYLRLKQEMQSLPPEELSSIVELFRIKSPLAYEIGEQLSAIIDKYDLEEPSEMTEALYQCIKYLDQTQVGNAVFDYSSGLYSLMLAAMKNRYPLLREPAG
ncbi:MAG: hypothetical protein Q7U88_11670 [Desulfocapsaceae bacterium]|nr:hypothetical protein [Desulfocapsaceae bacterium]